MTNPRNRLPENTSLVMPRLVCEDAAAEMEFCLRTFEAEELNRRDLTARSRTACSRSVAR
jgi:hypothetical protein